MLEIATSIGCDCAFFITNKPQIAQEKGDKLKPIAINLKGYYLLIIVPPFSISTKEAYNNLIPKP